MKRFDRKGGDRRLGDLLLLQNDFGQPVDLRLERLRRRVVVEHRLKTTDLVFLTVNFFTELQQEIANVFGGNYLSSMEGPKLGPRKKTKHMS